MRYTATGHRSQYFELYNDMNQPLGRLNYAEWFSSKAEVTLEDGDSYQLAPSNFWLTSIEMRKGDEFIASAKRGWMMNVVVTIGSTEYHFKGEGLLNRQFVLTTDAGQDIAVLKPSFQWRELSFSYEIETDDNYSELASPAIVLFLIYTCNYITRSHGAGAVSV